MEVKPYTTNDQPSPVATEPAFIYGTPAKGNEAVPPTGKNMRERMSVDEYFDELWSMYLTKRENIQA